MLHAVLLFLALSAHWAHHAHAVLPDHRVTPGVVDPALTKARLCSPAFRTGTVRNVDQSQKVRACLNYGITKGCPGRDFEIDHLVSIELGGANDIFNLWPEPVDSPAVIGYHTKDKVENAAHRAVCSGKISLEDAQRGIATDWYELGKKIGAVR